MPDINLMNPKSGRVLKEDNSVINLADLSGGNNVVFHDAVTVTGDGTSHNVGGFKTLTLSCKGTSTSRTIEVHGVDYNGVDNILALFSVVDFTEMTTLTTKDLSVQCSIEGMSSVYAKITAIAGGNATIKGTLTA